MGHVIDRCFKLATDRGLNVEMGEHDGQSALFHAGVPFAVFVTEEKIELKTTHGGSLQLLQTNREAFDHPRDKNHRNAVLMDCAKLSDEEIAIHLEQSCHSVA